MCIIIPSIIGAACFQPVFCKLNNKGRTASIFALLTGIAMLAMFFFNAKESPVAFYALAGITQLFFSGFNTAIYAIMKHAFTTVPGILWIVTAIVLFFYRLNKKRYNEIVEDLKNGKRG